MVFVISILQLMMSIKSPSDLQVAIDLAIAGNKEILYDLGKYITYNYYMYTHIKKDSPEDLENEKIYTKFREEYPLLYKEVETYVDFNFQKMTNDDD